jgi:hypothetical protein
VSVLAFAPRRTRGRWAALGRAARWAVAVAPMVPVLVARVALAAGVWLLTGELGWGLLVFGLLVAAWPRRVAR